MQIRKRRINLKVITSPATEPVTLANVREQIGITDASDTTSDAIITRRIIEARQWTEGFIRRALINQTLEIRQDCFTEFIPLPAPPVSSVTSVKYIDTDGVEQTLGASNYVLDDYPLVPFIREAYGTTWPSVRDEPNAVRVRYVAGYGANATDVPQLIREAIMLIVGHWMNFQTQSENGILPARIPFAIQDMLSQYIVHERVPV
jgi:uncharacterized phiE125 gp8 family phage protein